MNNLDKIRAVKAQIEKQLTQWLEEAKAQGIDVESPEAQQAIEAHRQELIKTAGINPKLLDSLKNYDEAQEDEAQTLLEKKLAKKQWKESTDKQVSRLDGLEERIKTQENRLPDWEDVQKKPKLNFFEQAHIQNLPYSQINHPDTGHKTFGVLSGRVDDLQGNHEAIQEVVGKLADAIIKVSQKKVNYSEIEGKPKPQDLAHTLETHKDSELMIALKELIAKYPQDLEQAKMMITRRAGSMFTKDEADQLYSPIGTLVATFIDGELPTDSGNHTNYTLTYNPSPATSLKVYRNGQLMQNKAITGDYTLSGATITFLTANNAGDLIICDYRR